MNSVSVKQLVLKFALFTSLLLGLAGAVSAETLRWAAQNDILTLDPHSQNHATTNNLVGHAYEPLVRLDRELQALFCGEPFDAAAARATVSS